MFFGTDDPTSMFNLDGAFRSAFSGGMGEQMDVDGDFFPGRSPFAVSKFGHRQTT